MLTKKEYYVIGDGNCGPRAIIQSLLLEGLAYPQHKQFVCHFLKNIYQKNKDNAQLYVEYSPPSSPLLVDPLFGKCDPRPKSNLYEDTTYRLPLVQKAGLEQQILEFIDTYEKMEPTEESLALLIQKCMPETRGVSPTHDHLIYLLAAYLRFDMNTEMSVVTNKQNIQRFNNEVLPDLIEMGRLGYRPLIDDVIEANHTLERNTDAAFIACYLAMCGIGYVLLDIKSQSELANNVIYFKEKQPVLYLTTLTTGLHFSVQWQKPMLAINSQEILPSLPQSHHPTPSLTLSILNGFLLVFGISAVALALTVLSFKIGMIVASVGVASMVLGGYGFFKQTNQNKDHQVSCWSSKHSPGQCS